MAGDGLAGLRARPVGAAVALDALPEEARGEAVEIEGLGAERVEAFGAVIVGEADHTLHGGEGLFGGSRARRSSVRLFVMRGKIGPNIVVQS